MSNNISTDDLNRSLQAFPEFLRASDLVKLGLFRGRADVTVAKRKGESPPFIKLSPHKFVFPKIGLIYWLIEKHSDNNNMNIQEIKLDDQYSDIR